MAIQLKAKGEAVNFIGIIDMEAPRNYKKITDLLNWRFFKKFIPESPHIALIYIKLPTKDKVKDVRIILTAFYRIMMRKSVPGKAHEGRDRTNVVIPAWVTDVINKSPSPKREIIMGILKALDAYEPKPYNGKITLFTTPVKDKLKYMYYLNDPEMGWGRLVNGYVEAHRISGDHTSVMTMPFVMGLSEQLKKYLAKPL